MTALIANPPVLLHLLADRHGNPAALLLDLGAADCTRTLPVTMVPVTMLGGLAELGMRCLYRTGAPCAALDQAGWQALDPAHVLRVDHLQQPVSGPGSRWAPGAGPEPGAASAPVPGPGVQWLAGDWCMAPPPGPVGSQVASRALAMQLVQLVANDADTHEIEAVLRQDPTLSYHLLKLVNSLAIGANIGGGRRVTSFSQAILILGRVQLRRWLNLLLFSSREGDRRSPMLLARVSVRARAMELLAHETGLSKNQQEMAFMVGMFSLLGVLFGMTLADVLKPLTIGDTMVRALLDQEGELGRLLTVVEAAERDDHAALADQLAVIGIDGGQFNRAMLDAYGWMQSVALGKAGQAVGTDVRHA